jgi:DNA modification methylase
MCAMEVNKIYVQDALTGIAELPDQSVQCCVTSPPYYRLRDYGINGQVGLEPSPEAYIQHLVQIFAALKRVLCPDGTLWVNIGDTYNAYKSHTGDTKYAGKAGRPVHPRGLSVPTLKSKDLIGIPWMLAFALRADGWYLRQDIIWHKPNPMPESVTDRCTKAHEYIFLFSKSPKYYFDHEAIKEPIKDSSVRRLIQDIALQKGSDRVPGKANGPMKAVSGGRKARPGIDVHGGNQAKGHIPMSGDGAGVKGHSGYFKANGEVIGGGMANKRSVWTVPTHASREAHYATYPEDLIVDCIKAGSRPEDIVLDPFMGSGTTAIVAGCLGRRFIGFELNPKYAAMANRRLRKRLGLFYREM